MPPALKYRFDHTVSGSATARRDSLLKEGPLNVNAEHWMAKVLPQEAPHHSGSTHRTSYRMMEAVLGPALLIDDDLLSSHLAWVILLDFAAAFLTKLDGTGKLQWGATMTREEARDHCIDVAADLPDADRTLKLANVLAHARVETSTYFDRLTVGLLLGQQRDVSLLFTFRALAIYVLAAALSECDRDGRTFHDFRATVCSALAAARAAGHKDVSNGLIQAIVHWKTEESVLRYTHMAPKEYAAYVRLATDTDAGVVPHKDAPEADPTGTCAELSLIADTLAHDNGKRAADRQPECAPKATFKVQDGKTATAKGDDSWGLVGTDVRVLLSTWDRSLASSRRTCDCHVSAFIGDHEHPDGVTAPSYRALYVVTDEYGVHYALTAAVLKTSLSKQAKRHCTGKPRATSD